MARKADPKKAAEKAAKTEQLVTALKNRAALFRENDDTFQRLLRMSAKFHQYSPMNQVLIMMQAPDTVAVNSFKRWQEIGRQVRKGETAIYIRAPRPFKKENVRGEEEEHVAFRFVPVFPYEATDPIEGFEGSPWEPYRFPTLTEDVGEEYVTGLLRALEDQGVDVELFADARTYRGRFMVNGETPQIKLHVGMPMLQQLSTLVHEIAHYRHWKREPHTLRMMPPAIVEFIAEGAAHAVLHELGFDTSQKAVPYIAARQPDMGEDQERVVMKLLVEIVGDIMETVEAVLGTEIVVATEGVAA